MSSLLGSVGDWYNANDVANDPNSPYNQQETRQARGDLLGQIGFRLLAAAQPMSGVDRAQLIAGLGDVGPAYRKDLQGRLQERTTADDLRRQQAWDQMIASGQDMSAYGITPDMVTIMKDMPRDLQKTLFEDAIKSKFAIGKAATAGLQAIWLRNTQTGKLTPAQLVDSGGIIVGGKHYPDIPAGYEVDYGTISEQKAGGAARGKTLADLQINLPMANHWRQEAQNDIHDILADPRGIWQATGVGGGAMSSVPGSLGAQTRAKLISLKAKIMSQTLPAFANLRPMSDTDRKAVEDVLNNLDPDKLGPDQLTSALQQLQSQLDSLFNALQSQAIGDIGGGGYDNQGGQGGGTPGITIKEVK